jgi:hypothetical protein
MNASVSQLTAKKNATTPQLIAGMNTVLLSLS